MYRIGQSTDIHELVDNRKLVLGGIEIPFNKGLKGHSDGDALIHAIAEAILGALALNDLGHLFPDNDPNTLGIDSKIILAKVYEIMDKANYKINNVDSLIIIQEPKMSPYIQSMRQTIANILHCDYSQVNVKATTAEHLGVIGEGKAVEAQATIMLISK